MFHINGIGRYTNGIRSYDLVADGFYQPIFITAPPGDTTRLIIVEQSGYAKVIKNGITQTSSFLNVSSLVSANGFERGLLYLVFHPNYADSHYMYANYTDHAGDLVIARFEAEFANSDSILPSTAEIILTINEPEANHNGGTLFFGPTDEYLYISIGDGGGGGDQHGSIGNGQNLETLPGKIIRIDVNNGLPYSIPTDNPFVDAFGDDEIWSYGLRTPLAYGLR